MFNQQSGPAFTLDFEGIKPADVRGGLWIDGKEVSPEIVEAFVIAFTAAHGQAPTPAETVQGLVTDADAVEAFISRFEDEFGKKPTQEQIAEGLGRAF